MQIMLRVLTYDRAFKEHGEGDFVVLVLAGPSTTAQRDKVLTRISGLKLTHIQGRLLKYLPLDVTGADAIARGIEELKANALLLIDGTSSDVVAQAQREAASHHLYSLALDPSVVERKAALLGVSLRDGKPQILINVEGARGLHASFDNAVLRLARLIP
jgi:hypothetical protein